MGTTSSTVTALDLAERALRDATAETLLDTIVVLTHKVHGLEKAERPDHARIFELREQRRLAREEVLRRVAGGAR